MIRKISVVKIQNLVVNPNQIPLRWTLNNTNFDLNTFPTYINHKIFQNKEKNLFWRFLRPKGIFPKTSGYVQVQASSSI